MSGRVVIVDDSLTVRMDLGEAFREAGFDTVLCATAAEARVALAGGPAAVAVVDVMLPDADGVELLAELRSNPDTEGTPVILLSGEAEVKDRVRGLKRGANEYIGKPYESGYVVARARELLRRGSRHPDSPPAILIIDDSLTYRQELSESLHNAGYTVAMAASGEEGLRIAADLRPDALVVDGVMPEMDGTAVVRRIRLDPGLHATPCLLLTASEGAAGEVVALDAGSDAYVRKGEGTQVVLARLGAMLRAAAPRDGVRAATLLGPKRILAVDDSITYLEGIAEQLQVDGYEVIKAHSGEEALELLAVEEVDCILLDLLMPGLSGTETCRQIKQSSVLRNIPLIMLTAHDEPEAMIDGMNAGADDYVAKAAGFEVIRARLRAQLRRKQFEDEKRRIREELLRKQAEADAAHAAAEARKELLEQLSQKNAELAVHIGELERLNKELEVFAYSVSHDLRQPLRAMDGFSKVLLEDYGAALDEQGRHYLQRIRAGAQRMGDLIDGLLTLSRVNQKPIEKRAIKLDALARRVFQRLHEADPSRSVEVIVQPDLDADGDPHLMESVLENLVGNAWKFTAKRPDARIEVGARLADDRRVFYVRDNGAGFDMNYSNKLFGPFQRLHSSKEFQGTGIGLATVQRILHRHGGRIWAESQPERGATFFFSLRQEG